MGGIGDTLSAVPDLPPVHLVLVNPGTGLATPAVFKALTDKSGAPMPDDLPDWKSTGDLAAWLQTQRNDLELPARLLAPAIGVALARLQQTDGCLLARMSGSGATCFGLYASRTEAEDAASALREVQGGWWVTAASSWRIDSAAV
jgi:4-diphosphocytidyl-2-C-methyl-D-erythritol kinase